LDFVSAGPGDLTTLVTSRRRLTARVVVGADGAWSRVARCAGLQPADFRHIALQMEVPRILLGSGAAAFKRTIYLDLGSLADGYAWVFPRGDVLLIGVKGPAHQGPQLKRYHARLLARLGLGAPPLPLAARVVPHRVTPRAVMRDRVLLVGDAAGLADFWTGEGIFSALHSGHLAARQILKFFQGEPGALADYQTQVDREITPELTAAYQIAKVFNYLGPLAFRCLKRYNYPWEVFCRVMRGDRSFDQIKKRCRPDIFFHKLLVKSARNRPLA
jgi:flavin-dependent dehydrogenase